MKRKTRKSFLLYNIMIIAGILITGRRLFTQGVTSYKGRRTVMIGGEGVESKKFEPSRDFFFMLHRNTIYYIIITPI